MMANSTFTMHHDLHGQNHQVDKIRRGLLPTASSVTGHETINLKFIKAMNKNPSETMNSLMRMLNSSPDAIIRYVAKSQ